MSVERVRDAYASVADLYIELFGSREQVHADDLALIGRQLSIRPGVVLDVGCGPGHITGYLRSLGVDAVGIDLVPEFIAHARAADRFFSGDEVAAFEHKVTTAYRWPVDEFSELLARAGFAEVERLRRPSDGTHRPYAAIVAERQPATGAPGPGPGR